MSTFENAKNLFYSKVLISKALNMDDPGFGTGRYFEMFGLGHFSRHVFFPEGFFIELEKRLVEKFGEKAKYALYRAGKIFGWHFAVTMGTPQFQGKHVNLITKQLFKFMELTYAKSLSDTVDEGKQVLAISADRLAICSKCGLGFFLPLGGLAGLWAFAYQDKNIEAVQAECQFRGNQRCKLFAGPAGNLPAKPIICNDFEAPQLAEEYAPLNRVVKIEGQSLRSFSNQYLFRYNAGILDIWGERFIPLEISFFYLLENEIRKIGGDSILFEVAFDVFKKLAETGKIENTALFAKELLSATGWGRITILKEEKEAIVCEHFPWTAFYSKENDFPIFRGALSGLRSASGSTKNFKVKKITIEESMGIYLT